jgi:hypothetical protein
MSVMTASWMLHCVLQGPEADLIAILLVLPPAWVVPGAMPASWTAKGMGLR